ncbi:Inosine-uridine preferring nucleoside hydrolase-like protein [Leptotrombidium deliense]|uniref:Inosine-uridine preferring nucleoside hydrolase-like protein n=1 Tax=Leptotrombidium deliense TaxID=299467 RepID=A0A443S6J4_9ACAR|nr:Inosine-uridine preferring nucleoside hydrolase-like protein [Leptotrombidium deliense]
MFFLTITTFVYFAVFCKFEKLSKNEKEYIIIDNDGGSDDAMAIMMTIYELKKSNVELLGLTTVSGNTNIDNVITNNALTLQILNKSQNFPLFKGSTDSLLTGSLTDGHFGYDGLSNATFYYDRPMINLIDKKAAIALIELVKKFPKKVSLLCLGPLTNIALAFSLESKFFEYTKQLYILGGNIEAEGSTTAVSEFNFHFDPEAAYIVLKNAVCPITIIPWETLTKHSFTWDKYDELSNIKTRNGIYFKRITKILSDKRVRNRTVSGFGVGDVLLTAAFFNPESVTETKVWPATVELNGQFTRGQLVADKRYYFQYGIKFVTNMNASLIFAKLKDMLLS